MAYASMREKTRRKRIQKKCEVEFIANKETYRGVSDNFSINGLFIKTNSLLDLHSLLAIKVQLPDGSIANLEGRVTRVCNGSYDMGKASVQTRHGGMGIEIMQKDPNYIMFFMSLLSYDRS